MALIALSIIGCIDYLAYGTIFTRVMFRPKKKVDVFIPARKAVDERWEVVYYVHKRHIIKVRKRRANNSIYNKVPSLPMSFFVRIKGCVNFCPTTSVHKKRVFMR